MERQQRRLNEARKPERDPERIPRILSLIGEIWRQNPGMRLGQMLSNACTLSQALKPHQTAVFDEAFYIEDDLVEKALREFLGRH